MSTKVYVFICLCFVSICAIGCSSPEDIGRKQRVMEKREAVFKNGMELAAQNSRGGDDDVADIIGECSTFSYYIASQIE